MNTLDFIEGFLKYAQENLNTIIASSNNKYADQLLKPIAGNAYIYTKKDNIDQKRAEAIFIYDMPKSIDFESAFKAAIKKEWEIGIAYTEGVRDTSLKNLSKLLRYEWALQKLVQDYFKRCAFATPEVQGIEIKDETTEDDNYKYVVFRLHFIIAGA